MSNQDSQIDSDHECPREENISFDNNNILFGNPIKNVYEIHLVYKMSVIIYFCWQDLYHGNKNLLCFQKFL